VKPIARSNNRGFTLVEVLVAMVILSIAMLGVLEAMTIAMQHNLELYCRDESVRIAEQDMNEARNVSFTAVADRDYEVKRTYKKFERSFRVIRTVAALSANSSSVQIQVYWTINGKGHNHYVTSIVSRGI
jgi:prepilin-type N-terminal cleavage/methylation domain-containing protein